MKAYSYKRWSSDIQSKGDSFARQADSARAICIVKGWQLDESLVPDSGISGWKGANLSEGSLGRFKHAVETGKIKTPCVLIIDDLSRFSRLPALECMDALRELLNLNVIVCTANNGKEYTKSSLNDLGDLILLCVSAHQNNQHSQELSRKVGAAWKRKKQSAKTKIVTRSLPAWVKIDEKTGKLVENKPKADLLRRIFKIVADGTPLRTVMRQLNKGNVQPFGRGKQNHGNGWSSTHMRRLLTGRNVLAIADKNLPANSKQSAKSILSGIYDLKPLGGSNTMFEQMFRQLQTEQAGRSPERVEAQQTLKAANFQRQMEIDAALNAARTSQRVYYNSGSFAAANTLNVQDVARQFTLNRALVSGPDSVANRQAQAGVYRQKFGERTMLQYEGATEQRRIEAERVSQVQQTNTDATRTIVSTLTQNFDENIKGITEMSRNAGMPGAGLFTISSFKAPMLEAINRGISSAVKSGSLTRFVGSNGSLDVQGMLQDITGRSTKDTAMQGAVLRYLQGNMGVDLLKNILEIDKRVVDINSQALNESQKQTVAMEGMMRELDFKQLANYMGGIRNLLDRNSRRTMERNLTRGAFLMERGRTPEAKAMGAAMLLNTFKDMQIPLDLSGKSPLSKLMQRAMTIGPANLGLVQQASMGRVLGSVSRLGLGAYGGMRELASRAGVGTGMAAFQAEYKPESQNIIQGAQVDFTRTANIFNNELVSSANALAGFVDSLDITKSKMLAAWTIAQSVQQTKSAEITTANVDFATKYGTPVETPPPLVNKDTKLAAFGAGMMGRAWQPPWGFWFLGLTYFD